MWNGMTVYLIVSFIFLTMAGIFLYKFNDMAKDVKAIKEHIEYEGK